MYSLLLICFKFVYFIADDRTPGPPPASYAGFESERKPRSWLSSSDPGSPRRFADKLLTSGLIGLLFRGRRGRPVSQSRPASVFAAQKQRGWLRVRTKATQVAFFIGNKKALLRRAILLPSTGAFSNQFLEGMKQLYELEPFIKAKPYLTNQWEKGGKLTKTAS